MWPATPQTPRSSVVPTTVCVTQPLPPLCMTVLPAPAMYRSAGAIAQMASRRALPAGLFIVDQVVPLPCRMVPLSPTR